MPCIDCRSDCLRWCERSGWHVAAGSLRIMLRLRDQDIVQLPVVVRSKPHQRLGTARDLIWLPWGSGIQACPVEAVLTFHNTTMPIRRTCTTRHTRSISASYFWSPLFHTSMRCYTRHRHRRRSKSKSTFNINSMFTANAKKSIISDRTIDQIAANTLNASNGTTCMAPPTKLHVPPKSPNNKLPPPSSRSPSSAMTVAEGKKLSIRLEAQEDMVRQTLGSIQKEWSIQQTEIAKAISDAGHARRLEQRQCHARDMVHVELLMRNAIKSRVEIALESGYAERIFSLETEVAILRAEAAIDRRRLKTCCTSKDRTPEGGRDKRRSLPRDVD